MKAPSETHSPASQHRSHRFCVAPMIDWSDRHCRYLWRLMSKHALLYSEMVSTGAILHGDRERFLGFNNAEHPLALQLGGSNPAALAACARLAQDRGFDEVNLNCGCPSDKVQEGKIGAILMSDPGLVRECMSAMIEACDIPITIKHRIGIDDMEDYDDMRHFVEEVAKSGCETFIIHARKAWLKGLSPKQNREVPPLNYEQVYQLKRDLPHLNVVINGGITTTEQCQTLLAHVDGVMIGREAYNNPYFINRIDGEIFDVAPSTLSRIQVAERYADYCAQQVAQGARLHHMTRHILGLFIGEYGARLYRRHITEHANKPGANAQVLLDALDFVRPRHSPLVTSDHAR